MGVDYAFRGLDADNDGKIYESELEGALKIGTFDCIVLRNFVSHMHSTYDKLEDAWDALRGKRKDINYRGFVVSGVGKFKSPMPRDQAIDAFHAFDTSKDNKINHAEFVDAVEACTSSQSEAGQEKAV